MREESPVVVGIDVGGPKKGFHAVALQGTEIIAQLHSICHQDVADFCLKVEAMVVAIDCPCRWREAKYIARPAECQLARIKISTYSTPVQEGADAHPKDNYGWIINGQRVYELLEKTYKLYDGKTVNSKVVFETFPQAVACALAGHYIYAKEKAKNRPPLLTKLGIDISQLPNQDWIDAALCAITAQHLINEKTTAYGEERTGFIVVPAPKRIKHNIRRANPSDAKALAEIVNHSILTSTANFHLEPLSVQSQREFIQSASDCHPVLVCELENKVVGWASLKPYSPRAAYSQTVESSVYIHPDFHRKGIGSALMEEIIRQAKAQNHHSIIAGATAEQTASIKLHESLGFKKVAHYKEMGFKFGRWLDTVYLQLMLE